MQWRDTPQRYGTISRALHWLMAALLLWQFTGMALRLTLGRVPLVSFFVGTHAPLGTLLLVLVLVRLLWAFFNRRNRPPHEAGPVGRLARAGHGALYALMLAVPALGFARLYGSGRGFRPFGVEVFAPREERIGWLMAPAEVLHAPLAWTLLALIAGHAGMAAVHALLWRDRIAGRMLGRGGHARLGN